MKLSESIKKIAAEIEKTSQTMATLPKHEVLKAISDYYWKNY